MAARCRPDALAATMKGAPRKPVVGNYGALAKFPVTVDSVDEWLSALDLVLRNPSPNTPEAFSSHTHLSLMRPARASYSTLYVPSSTGMPEPTCFQAAIVLYPTSASPLLSLGTISHRLSTSLGSRV